MQLTFAHFFGPGEVVVAPETWGDIAQIQLDGSSPWFFGKHAFLACTPGIQMSTKSQSLGKAICMFSSLAPMYIANSVAHSVSGSGLFVGVAQGAGILFVHGMGAVIARELQPGEQWIGRSQSVADAI